MFEKRLEVELKKAKLDSDKTFFLFPEENLTNWKAYLLGPEDSPYEGGAFLVKLEIAMVGLLFAHTIGLSGQSTESDVPNEDLPSKHSLGHWIGVSRHLEE